MFAQGIRKNVEALEKKDEEAYTMTLEEIRSMQLCYDCANFCDDGSENDLKCLVRKTYVYTPTKARHCRTFKLKEE